MSRTEEPVRCGVWGCDSLDALFKRASVPELQETLRQQLLQQANTAEELRSMIGVRYLSFLGALPRMREMKSAAADALEAASSLGSSLEQLKKSVCRRPQDAGPGLREVCLELQFATPLDDFLFACSLDPSSLQEAPPGPAPLCSKTASREAFSKDRPSFFAMRQKSDCDAWERLLLAPWRFRLALRERAFAEALRLLRIQVPELLRQVERRPFLTTQNGETENPLPSQTPAEASRDALLAHSRLALSPLAKALDDFALRSLAAADVAPEAALGACEVLAIRRLEEASVSSTSAPHVVGGVAVWLFHVFLRARAEAVQSAIFNLQSALSLEGGATSGSSANLLVGRGDAAQRVSLLAHRIREAICAVASSVECGAFVFERRGGGGFEWSASGREDEEVASPDSPAPLPSATRAVPPAGSEGSGEEARRFARTLRFGAEAFREFQSDKCCLGEEGEGHCRDRGNSARERLVCVCAACVRRLLAEFCGAWTERAASCIRQSASAASLLTCTEIRLVWIRVGFTCRGLFSSWGSVCCVANRVKRVCGRESLGAATLALQLAQEVNANVEGATFCFRLPDGDGKAEGADSSWREERRLTERRLLQVAASALAQAAGDLLSRKCRESPLTATDTRALWSVSTARAAHRRWCQECGKFLNELTAEVLSLSAAVDLSSVEAGRTVGVAELEQQQQSLNGAGEERPRGLKASAVCVCLSAFQKAATSLRETKAEAKRKGPKPAALPDDADTAFPFARLGFCRADAEQVDSLLLLARRQEVVFLACAGAQGSEKAETALRKGLAQWKGVLGRGRRGDSSLETESEPGSSEFLPDVFFASAEKAELSAARARERLAHVSAKTCVSLYKAAFDSKVSAAARELGEVWRGFVEGTDKNEHVHASVHHRRRREDRSRRRLSLSLRLSRSECGTLRRSLQLRSLVAGEGALATPLLRRALKELAAERVAETARSLYTPEVQKAGADSDSVGFSENEEGLMDLVLDLEALNRALLIGESCEGGREGSSGEGEETAASLLPSAVELFEKALPLTRVDEARDRAASALASSEALTFALRSTWAAAEFLPRGKGTSELSSQSAAAAPSLLSEPRRRLSLLPVAPSEGARKKSFFFAAVSETPPACVRGGWASSADACVVAQPFLRAAFEGLPRLLAADGGARSRTGLSGLRSERTERGEDSAEGATASRRGNNDLLSHPFPSPQNEAPQQMTGSSRLDGAVETMSSVSRGIHSWLGRDWSGAASAENSASNSGGGGGSSSAVLKEALSKQVGQVGALIGKHVESMHSRVSLAVGASLQNSQNHPTPQQEAFLNEGVFPKTQRTDSVDGVRGPPSS